MENRDSKTCCDMRRKVALGIVKVFGESECGVSDAAMADFYDFSQGEVEGVPIAAALTVRFCPWCGTERRPDHESRTTVNYLPRHPD